MKKIKDIPKPDRPREKLLQKVLKPYKILNCLAILIVRGVEGHDVISVAVRVLKVMDMNKEKPEFPFVQICPNTAKYSQI